MTGSARPAIRVGNKRFDLVSRITVGRDPVSDVVIDHPLVSRSHGELRLLGASWNYFDTSSRGTYCDGKRVSQLAVNDKVQLNLGDPNIGVTVEIVPLNGATTASTPTSVQAERAFEP